MPESAVDDSIPFEPSLFERVFVRGRPVPLGPLALPPRARRHLPLGLPLARLPDPRPHRPARSSPGRDYLRELAAQLGPVQRVWFAPSFLWLGAGDGALTALVVVGLRRVAPPRPSTSPARRDRRRRPRVPLVHRGRARVRDVPVRRDAARGGVPVALLRPARLASRARRRDAPVARRALPSALGVVPDLLRVGRREDREPRPAVGRASPRWTTTTRTARSRRGSAGTRSTCRTASTPSAWSSRSSSSSGRVARLARAARAARVLRAPDAVPDRDHPHGELRLPELPRPRPRRPAPRRRAARADRAPGDARRRDRAPAAGAAYGAAFVLSWIFYVTVMTGLHVPRDTPLALPVVAVEPARIANAYGLFAVMTESRYELEFQATRDGVTWVPYRYRFKPQDLNEAPGIYAPYQPRFEWNLWFASLGWGRGTSGSSRPSSASCSVTRRARALPRGPAPRRRAARGADGRVAVLVHLLEEHRRTGAWWTRKYLGLYAPMLERKSRRHHRDRRGAAGSGSERQRRPNRMTLSPHARSPRPRPFRRPDRARLRRGERPRELPPQPVAATRVIRPGDRRATTGSGACAR